MALKKNAFPWNMESMTSAKIGRVVPMFYEELEPNATVKLNPHHYVKLAPMALPTHGRFQLKVTFFFVPFRQVWANFEKEILSPGSYAHPFIDVHPTVAADLADDQLLKYLPMAQEDAYDGVNPIPVSALPYRVYQKGMFDHYTQDASNLHTTDLTYGYATTDGADVATYKYAHNAYYPRRNNRYAHLQTEQQIGAVPTVAAPFTLNNIRQLIADTRLKERLASVAKDATNAVAAIFGVQPPVNTHSTLVSQLVRDLDLREIISQSSTDILPLGATVSMGALTTKTAPNEQINFTAPEYGALMGVVSLTPYCYEAHGARPEYEWIDSSSPSRWYHPELCGVGLVPIRKREIFKANDFHDGSILGYEAPYGRLRAPLNYIAGDYRLTKTDYVVHRNAFADNYLVKIVQNDEYDYLFADTDEPQVRFTTEFTGVIERPVPRILSNDSLQITESIIADSERI